MRVALNLEQLLHPAPGGIGRQTAELTRLLPERGVEVVPFVARHTRAQVRKALRAADLDGLDPVVLPLPRPVLYDAWHVLGHPRLESSRRLGEVDVVHAPSVAVPPRGRAPLVVTVHDAAPVLFPETFSRRGRWFHARGIAAAKHRADLVITVSEVAADELVHHAGFARERLRVVHNGVELQEATDEDVAAARARHGLVDTPYVLFVGTLEPRKNLAVLIDAFTRLVDETEFPHVLAVVGPEGWVTRHAVPAEAAGLGERLRMLGPVAGSDLWGLYRGAEVFAHPSRHEGFGIPVLEAMAQRRAVVGSDIPVLREVSGGHARLVPPDDVDGWRRALAELLGDAAARARMGEAGRVWAERFSWARCAEATAAVYREAVR
jgi:glycosyltransferase involved in cell wall biosynthesis